MRRAGAGYAEYPDPRYRRAILRIRRQLKALWAEEVRQQTYMSNNRTAITALDARVGVLEEEP
jgi:hypothetical protein